MPDQLLNPSDLIYVSNIFSKEKSDWHLDEFLFITDDDKIFTRESQIAYKYCFPFYNVDKLATDDKVILEARNGVLKYATKNISDSS